jgi:putative glycosyltransferase (TIGR04372 family)
MDVFLAATNRFCLGTSSGYWTIPIFFEKPVLLVNVSTHIEYFGLSKNVLFLPKHLVDKSTKKAIPLENLFSLRAGFIIDDEQYVKRNIKIIDNSEDEILQAAKEMLDILDNKQLNDNFKINNTKFKNLVNSQNTNSYEFPVKAMANISSSYLNKYLN